MTDNLKLASRALHRGDYQLGAAELLNGSADSGVEAKQAHAVPPLKGLTTDSKYTSLLVSRLQYPNGCGIVIFAGAVGTGRRTPSGIV